MGVDDRIKMWLLCLCSAGRVGTRQVLFEEADRRAQWNDYTTDMTGWTRERILNALFLLTRQGYIEFGRRIPDVCMQPAAIPREEVEALTHSELMDNVGPRVIYGFTGEGGRFWEEHFKPDWSRYNTGWVTSNKLLLICASSALRYEMLGASLDYIGCDKQFGLREVRTGVRNKWQATYWKDLERGFFASARFREDDESWKRDMPLAQDILDLFRPWESFHISLIPQLD